MAACIDHGPELDRTFVLSIRFNGKPLRGARVQLTGQVKAERFTGRDGKVKFNGLQPGDYWLSADFLGIGAGSQCFHILTRPSRKAKHTIQYTWGDDAIGTRQLSGRILDPQPGTGRNPIWNLTHRVMVPVANVEIVLRDPVTGETSTTKSDPDGTFAFDHLSRGTYVLHIQTGNTGRGFEPTDLLVRLSPKADRNTLVLLRTEPSGGSCGGTTLVLQ